MRQGFCDCSKPGNWSFLKHAVAHPEWLSAATPGRYESLGSCNTDAHRRNHQKLSGFLGRLNGSKFLVEQQIVEDFQPSRDKEWNVYERGSGKQKSSKQGTDGRACRTRDSRNPSGRGS